mgnify:CR=1 FL=1
MRFSRGIPRVIELGKHNTGVKTTDALHFYGYYEYTGWRGFFRKVRLGIKQRTHVNRG